MTKKFERKPNRTGLCLKKARQFVDLYRGDPETQGNKTACYKKMNPRVKDSTAQSGGSRYFNDPLVQELLEEHANRIAVRADVTQERVMQELACLGFYDVRKLFNDDGSPKGISELDDETARAIVGLDAVNIGNSDAGIGQVIKYKLADKRSALVDMGKQLGMFKERVEHTGKDGGPIETKDLSDNEVARRIAFFLTKAAKTE